MTAGAALAIAVLPADRLTSRPTRARLLVCAAGQLAEPGRRTPYFPSAATASSAVPAALANFTRSAKAAHG